MQGIYRIIIADYNNELKLCAYIYFKFIQCMVSQ